MQPDPPKYITEAGPFPSRKAYPMYAAGIFEGPIKKRTPVEFTLVVGEHDAGTVSVDEAVARLDQAGIAADLFTTASHTLESPRWRVVAPLQAPCGAKAHCTHLDLLNGALGGALAGESADLNTRWFCGHLEAADSLGASVEALRSGVAAASRPLQWLMRGACK